MKEDIKHTENSEENPRTAEKLAKKNQTQQGSAEEFGGPEGLEPTRYGDWEVKGRVSDF